MEPPTFFTRFLVVRTVSISSISDTGVSEDSLASGSCEKAPQSRLVTHYLNHSYLTGILSCTTPYDTLQLCNVRRSTAAHFDPLDSSWTAIWLNVRCSRTECMSCKPKGSPVSVSSCHLPSLSCPCPFMRHQYDSSGLKR
jgi:hypothetical protein